MNKILYLILILLIIGTLGLAYWSWVQNTPKEERQKASLLQNLSNFVSDTGQREIKVINDFFRGQVATATDPVAAREENRLSAQRFLALTEETIAGAGLVTVFSPAVKGKSGQASSSIWYMDKKTGHLFSIDPQSLAKTEISNTTLPGVAELYFGSSGNRPQMIARYLKNGRRENFSFKVAGTSTPGELSGTYLEADIYSLALSPNKQQLFYLISSDAGALGYLSDLNGTSRQLIFSSAFPRFNPVWTADNEIILISAPAADQNGIVYALNLKNKTVEKILTGKNGLTAKGSPDGKKLIYASNGENNKLMLKIRGEEGTVFLGVATLPEKCVWTKNAKFLYCAVPKELNEDLPDAWYQGKVSFNDKIWRIDTSTGAAEEIFDPSGSGLSEGIDGIELFLDTQERDLYFLDRKQEQLWRYTLDASFNAPAGTATSTFQ